MAENQITWEKDIQHFFTQLDIGCMLSFGVDLKNYEDVKKWSPGDNGIYERVKSGNMPRGARRWPQGKVKDYKAWMDSGYPFSDQDVPA